MFAYGPCCHFLLNQVSSASRELQASLIEFTVFSPKEIVRDVLVPCQQIRGVVKYISGDAQRSTVGMRSIFDNAVPFIVSLFQADCFLF